MINISSERVIAWADCLREHSYSPVRVQHILQSFEEQYIRNRAWLVNTVSVYTTILGGNAYVFGGRHGVLASMIADNWKDIERVYNIDNDPECAIIGKIMHHNDPRIEFITCDATDFARDRYIDPELIVNTCTAHLAQEEFDTWMAEVPDSRPIVLQGSNRFMDKGHVRCSETLEAFVENNHLDNIRFSGILPSTKGQQFMLIGSNERA